MATLQKRFNFFFPVKSFKFSVAQIYPNIGTRFIKQNGKVFLYRNVENNLPLWKIK